VYRTTYDGTNWSAFQMIDSPNALVSAAPAVVSTGDNQYSLFLVRTDGSIAQQNFTNGTRGNLLQISGPKSTDVAPSVVNTGSKVALLFKGYGSDTSLYERDLIGTTWGPTSRIDQGQITYSAPSATALNNGKIAMFWTGTDNSLYQQNFNGTRWTAIKQVSGSPTGIQKGGGNDVILVAPSGVSTGSGKYALFVTGTDGALYDETYSNQIWSPFEQLAGPSSTAVGPAAVSLGNQRIAVFISGTNGALYEKLYD